MIEIEYPQTATIAEEAQRRAFEISATLESTNHAKWWFFEVFGFKVYCYNFQWRQMSIARHDLHHIVTGYPCTLAGEVQVAAWEFAAGRFPNVFSNLFCLPLIACGIFIMPRKLWTAFKYGRRCCSLYATTVTEELLNSDLQSLRASVEKNANLRAKFLDVPAFCLLISLALLLVTLPILPAILLYSNILP